MAGVVRIMRKARLNHVRNNRQHKEPVLCRRCGEILTSPRSIRLGIGQRCKWAEDEENGTRIRRNTEITKSVKDEVPFKESGGRHYQRGYYDNLTQTKITDW